MNQEDLMAATTADETPSVECDLTTSHDESEIEYTVRPPPGRRTRLNREHAHRHNEPCTPTSHTLVSKPLPLSDPFTERDKVPTPKLSTISTPPTPPSTPIPRSVQPTTKERDRTSSDTSLSNTKTHDTSRERATSDTTVFNAYKKSQQRLPPSIESPQSPPDSEVIEIPVPTRHFSQPYIPPLMLSAFHEQRQYQHLRSSSAPNTIGIVPIRPSSPPLPPVPSISPPPVPAISSPRSISPQLQSSTTSVPPFMALPLPASALSQFIASSSSASSLPPNSPLPPIPTAPPAYPPPPSPRLEIHTHKIETDNRLLNAEQRQEAEKHEQSPPQLLNGSSPRNPSLNIFTSPAYLPPKPMSTFSQSTSGHSLPPPYPVPPIPSPRSSSTPSSLTSSTPSTAPTSTLFSSTSPFLVPPSSCSPSLSPSPSPFSLSPTPTFASPTTSTPFTYRLPASPSFPLVLPTPSYPLHPPPVSLPNSPTVPHASPPLPLAASTTASTYASCSTDDYLLASQAIAPHSDYSATRTAASLGPLPDFSSSFSASSEGWSENSEAPVYVNPTVFLRPTNNNNQTIVVSPPLNLEREAKLREMKQNERLNEIFAISALQPERNPHKHQHQHHQQQQPQLWLHNALESLISTKSVMTLSTTSGSQTTEDTNS